MQATPSPKTVLYAGGPIFDGTSLHHGAALEVLDNRIVALHELRPDRPCLDLQGDILAPGFVDLQVNGGGGVFVGAAADSLTQVVRAHRALGTTSLLHTLITERPEITEALLEQPLPDGALGLHLEGPHLDPRKAGAHDPALIRPMNAQDLALYIDAAQRMTLKITLAPEAVTIAQLRALVTAGAHVFLGHSACSYETACAYFAAGAKGVTHIWNAMSPLTSREPGLVGAALERAGFIGLIADNLHVHAATMKATIAAAEGRVFLVSDAMACAGTTADRFELGGRTVHRAQGALRLEDGTLAGADLDLRRAVSVMVHKVGVPLEEALAMATSRPAQALGVEAGRLVPGARADLIRLAPDLSTLTVL